MAETVLVVEDEPEFGELVELWMSRAGYRVVTARTGPDALRRFHEERPDLVIVDVALTRWFLTTAEPTARPRPSGSMPIWLRKRRSSTEIIAARISGGIWS